MHHPFYSRLSYSFGNEDWLTEHRALQIQPDSEVLCITASGDRPLNLLSTNCKRLHSIDANPVQNALFDLKKTALTHFSYDDYIAFLGIDPMTNRLKRYEELKAHLATASRPIWRRHRRKIQKGVLFQGTIEKLSFIASRCIRLLRRKKLEKLFEFDDISLQADFIENEFDTTLWRKSVEFALHPKLVCTFLRDPGLTDHVDEKIHIGRHIHQRLHSSLKRFLAKESILISLMFNGKVDRDHLPPYLSKEGALAIQSRLHKVSFETSDLIRVLERTDEKSFDRFSFSDVASYLPYPTYEKMMHLMVRAAKPGARFCVRQFLSNYPIPPAVLPYLKRDPVLEKQLEEDDRCCLYRFLVGEVVK